MAPSPLVFNVRRQQPVLVAPAKPTPHEFKPLSDIDDQEILRLQIPVILCYRKHALVAGRNLAQLLRQAIAEALVFYYPFAGRVRERPGRKLVVECTGEGVLFIEADADVALDQFGDALQPPFPCLEELLYDVPDSGDILNCPLLLFQLTHFTCGGYIIAIRFNHTLSDMSGIIQFMLAVGQMALGARAPSIPPVWHRELLDARDPPRVTCVHREYDEVPDTKAGTVFPLQEMAQRSFFFGPGQIAALRKHVPEHLRTCTTFELLTACLWKCRTMAMGAEPNEEVSILFVVNARAKYHPPLPAGYYGNVLAFPAAVSPAWKLFQNSLGYGVELVKKAKSHVTQEYMQSVADLMVLKGRPPAVLTWMVSDLTRGGFGDVDFGSGAPVYIGPAKTVIVGENSAGSVSFYVPFRNIKGEDGILVPICLPGPAMERFSIEIESMINHHKEEEEA